LQWPYRANGSVALCPTDPPAAVLEQASHLEFDFYTVTWQVTSPLQRLYCNCYIATALLYGSFVPSALMRGSGRTLLTAL
jgi:hypothetical protein